MMETLLLSKDLCQQQIQMDNLGIYIICDVLLIYSFRCGKTHGRLQKEAVTVVELDTMTSYGIDMQTYSTPILVQYITI